MSLKCGIVGLPNVGKSTLFNAPDQVGASRRRIILCTIEPTLVFVEVPDKRLAQLSKDC